LIFEFLHSYAFKQLLEDFQLALWYDSNSEVHEVMKDYVESDLEPED
jgi:hypothetical protein